MLGIENIYIVDPGSSPPLSDYLQGFIASGVVHYQWQASTAGQLALLVPLHAATRAALACRYRRGCTGSRRPRGPRLPSTTGASASLGTGERVGWEAAWFPPPGWAQVREWGGVEHC